MKAIISGGGTGGHIFPAISIADALKRRESSNEILFVGARGKMEMEKVPAAGYEIKGLPVAGLNRKLSLSNLKLPFKVMKSCSMARHILKEFKPDIAIGVGGYASAPLLWSASKMGIPCLIQEQNSFAGLTNRTLAKRAACICVAYDNMERFFPADKIVFTGNPIRKGFADLGKEARAEGCSFYGLDPEKKHILVVGGSLGCRTLNESMKKWMAEACPAAEGVQVLWQFGRIYKSSVEAFLKDCSFPDVKPYEFITRMDLAYAAADLVISRSGASSISELCVCRKPTIFVPSPNVSEDHQTFNAMSLVNKGAARIVKDCDAPQILMKTALELVHEDSQLQEISSNMIPLGIDNAAERIVEQVYKILEK